VCFREVHALTGDLQRQVLKLHADYQRIWAAALADGAERGVFRKIPGVTLKGLLGMYFYSFLWLDPQGRQSPEEIGDAFADIVLRAARPASAVAPALASGSGEIAHD
jgi:hypothetical protein